MNTTTTGPKRRMLMWGVAAITGLLFGAALFWVLAANSQRSAIAENVLDEYGAVPDMTFTEKSGKQISLNDLKGKIWVGNFIFTRCAGSCLLMSAKMKALQTELAKNDNVTLVSFSVDPEFDTPERLQSYADKYEAGNKWLFLTGDEKQIQDLSVNTFHLSIMEGTSEEEPIIHSSRFVLVDENGDIRGFYNTNDDASTQELLKAITTLTEEME